ncbi:MAG: DegV family protein [Clostridium sp.]
MTTSSNNEKIAILIDSGCDVSHELIEKYHMKVLRLHVLYPEKDYSDDLDIDPQMIYDRFPGEIPTTSTPSPQEVKDMVDEIKAEGYTHILAFSISSGLSGTYNTICSVLNEEHDIVSFALDTKNISSGAGILAIWAAKQLEEGKTYNELVDILPDKIKDSKVLYYMDTLTYLQKGGRIGLVTSIVGNILNLKPVISCNKEGVYYTVAKIRGAKQGLSKLLSEITSYAGDTPCWMILLNGDAKTAADTMRPKLTAAIPHGTLIMEKQITASMAVHTGPGLVGIIILKL